MPYISCPHCAVTTYCVTHDECPVCGTTLTVGGAAPGPRPRTGARLPHGAATRTLMRARERLGVDAAVLTEVLDGYEVVRQVSQDDAFPGLVVGLSAPLEDTICRRLLEGRVGSLVADVRADAELGALPMIGVLGIGAYLGVPLTAADARLYLLCCLAREARPDLGEEDVRAVRALAGRLRATHAPVGQARL